MLNRQVASPDWGAHDETSTLWTFLVVFVATALVTLLGLVGALSIKEEYLNKLFYLLLIEATTPVVALGRLIQEDGLLCKSTGASESTRNFIISAGRAAGDWWSPGASQAAIVV